MADQQPQAQDAPCNNKEKEELANARVGYEAALGLWGDEGEFLWSKFEAMLIGNSILVAAIVALLTSDSGTTRWSHPCLVILLSLVGLLLSYLWACVVNRSERWCTYWLRSARDLEECLRPVQTLQRGAKLMERRTVCFKHLSRGKPVQQHPPPVPVIKVLWAAYVFVIAFGFVYCVLLGFGVRALCGLSSSSTAWC